MSPRPSIPQSPFRRCPRSRGYCIRIETPPRTAAGICWLTLWKPGIIARKATQGAKALGAFLANPRGRGASATVFHLHALHTAPPFSSRGRGDAEIPVRNGRVGCAGEPGERGRYAPSRL